MANGFFEYKVTYWDEVDEKMRQSVGLTFAATLTEAIRKVGEYYGEDAIDDIEARAFEEGDCFTEFDWEGLKYLKIAAADNAIDPIYRNDWEEDFRYDECDKYDCKVDDDDLTIKDEDDEFTYTIDTKKKIDPLVAQGFKKKDENTYYKSSNPDDSYEDVVEKIEKMQEEFKERQKEMKKMFKDFYKNFGV